MATPILMPKPGQMTEECVLTLWRKEVGDPVHKGDVLFEIETDKSTMEVETFEEGVLLAKIVADGDTALVNALCGWIGEAGEPVPEAPPAAEIPSDAAAEATATATASADTAPAPEAAVPVAPAVPAAEAPAPAAAPERATEGRRVKISPRASRLAAGAGIDPLTVAGSGPEGRIVERDVQAAIEARTGAPSPAVVPAAAATPPAPIPVAVLDGEDQPRPLSRMRRTIAARLTSSWQTAPHFTVTVAVDVTRVLALRAELREQGASLTVTDFVLSATAQTLAEFPDVNSRTDGELLYPRRRVHLGVAVAVPGGLVVPVVRDADRLPIAELHGRVAALAAAAREGSISPDDLAGSTFTVSNLGMFGVEEFSAIINPGEAAILAVSSAVATPVAVDGGIGIRQIMRLTLSADHRIVDGEMGARFLNALRRRLEDVRSFRDEVALS